MIALQYLRENPDNVIERLKIKNFDASEYVRDILHFDKLKRSLQKQLDDNLAQQNKIAKKNRNFIQRKKDGGSGNFKRTHCST
jgi:seryl-tRNA synthetase